jgi:ribosomal protein S18 acetylase RimI-like enzyme
MHYRTADILDIPAIRKVVEEVWPIAYGDIISHAQIDYMLKMMYSDESLLRQMTMEDCEFILAMENDQVLGFASYSEIEKGVYKLHKLYVYSTQQGKGTGKMLLDEVCRRVKESGGSSIELQVNKKNIAKRFYEKNGFTVKEEAVFDIGNGFVMDDYVMTKNVLLT